MGSAHLIVNIMHTRIIPTVSTQLFFWLLTRNDDYTSIGSHLLFANDIIIFCDPHLEKIRILRSILLFFEAAKRLRVNLGLPLGSHFKARTVWNGSIERMEG